MDEKERIKLLRISQKLNQKDFGRRIDLTTGAISDIERGKCAVTERTRRTICREFDVSETWLRTGEGEMFNPSPVNEMDALAGQYGLSMSEKELMEKFITLNPTKRKAALDYLREVVTAVNGDTPYKVPPGANFYRYARDMTPEEMHAELDRQLADEKERGDASEDSGFGDSGTAAG